uniref:Uncharacterized protein n=1 Tax=viral metagenome TaxID=1070528 RepID=A0A6M3L0Y5_9ZZZZ
MPFSVGTGIVLGCTVLGGIGMCLKLIGDKTVKKEVCDLNVTHITKKIDTLSNDVHFGFRDIKEEIKSIHQRMDTIKK